jgi:prepilin-type processing-associated H-X9-DG protein
MLTTEADPTTKRYESDMWGSPHVAAFNMVFCDGSVRAVSYDIDLLVHRWQHNRNSNN